MTAAKMRMVRGDMQYSSVSRFVKEIPEHLVDGTTYDPSISSSGRSGYSDSGDIFGGRSVKTDYGTGYTAKASYGSGYSGRSDYGSGFSETTGTGSKKKSAVKAPTYGTCIQRSNLEYNTGDRVSHRKFGEGTVTDISNGKRDYEVTVEFDSFGQKKMLASFAKLEKI
jgi:DNA helicase-2/ATP-dependent DNA helicase PcrA